MKVSTVRGELGRDGSGSCFHWEGRAVLGTGYGEDLLQRSYGVEWEMVQFGVVVW